MENIFVHDDYIDALALILRHGLEKISPQNIFFASFSEKPDLLSQWRGYCPPGAGVCLGFRINELRKFCEQRNYRLEKCLYDKESQTRRLQNLIDQCLQNFSSPSMSRDEYISATERRKAEFNIERHEQLHIFKKETHELLDWFCDEAQKVVSLFKNEGFHEEAEWRIIALNPQGKKKFRLGPSYLMPYIELEIFLQSSKLLLAEVIVAPGPNQSRCADSIKLLLDANGMQDVQVRCSATPYVAW